MNRYFGLHTLEGEWHALLPRYLLLSERVAGRRILDIGCGSGIGASLLLELGAQIVDAIDHRPAVLELARMKHAKQGLDFHVMFWEELDFPDDTFDLVLCLDPSSPVTDPSLIQEVKRVLKPGGEYVCAIERKQIEGFEVVLPRYGYADAAENIDVHPHDARPPQVGELRANFPTTASVVQRPSISFVFDVDAPSSEAIRKASEEGESGIWQQEGGGEGRWITVDDSLRKRDSDDAAVEIWFCGAEDASPPPLREIQLPYFGLVERLRQVQNELQMRQVRGMEDEPIFDEIVDAPAAEEENEELQRERVPTNEFRVVTFEDDMPTNVRNDLSIAPSADTSGHRDQLESQLNELAALYQQVRHDFQSVVRDAQTALEERDSYIEHLVNQVHEMQERFRSTAGGEDDLEEMTGVYEESEPSSDEAEAGPSDEPGQPSNGESPSESSENGADAQDSAAEQGPERETEDAPADEEEAR